MEKENKMPSRVHLHFLSKAKKNLPAKEWSSHGKVKVLGTIMENFSCAYHISSGGVWELTIISMVICTRKVLGRLCPTCA